MARTFWPNESAVGHTVQVVNGTRTRTYRIVGVNRDHKRHGVLEQPSPFVYFADSAAPESELQIHRGAHHRRRRRAAGRRCAASCSPWSRAWCSWATTTMEQNLGTSLMPARVGAMLAAAFGGLGTLLAAIGLYGVIAFSVARRTREIGVRMALGAKPAGVLSMVMRQGFSIVAIGLVVGRLLAAGAAIGAARPALRHHAVRSDRVGAGARRDDRRRRLRELRSGAPRDARRSDDGAADRITGYRPAFPRRQTVPDRLRLRQGLAYTSSLGGEHAAITCVCRSCARSCCVTAARHPCRPSR